MGERRLYLERYSPGGVWEPLDKFHYDIGLGRPPWIDNLYRLHLERARYWEVYLPSSEILSLLNDLSSRPFSLGLYYGILRSDKFIPSLPLAHFLAPKAEDLGIHTTTLTREGERFFLYGKIVLPPNYTAWRRGLMLVVNSDGEALGWGRGRIVKISGQRARAVEPIWDLGWYLRRGG